MHVGEVRVMVKVAELGAEVDFWSQQLGFPIERSFEGGAMLRVGSTIIEFFAAAASTRSATGFSLRVEDLDRLWSEWCGNDNVVFELRTNAWGDRSFSLITPNNLEITFFQSL